MTVSDWFFVVCLLLVAYPYFVYPFGLWLWSAVVPEREVARGVPSGVTATVLIAAYNEGRTVGRRLEELLGSIRQSALSAELILVSDGSTDDTVTVAESVPGVKVIALAENHGKAVALNEGVAQATGDVVVFGDARQTWAPDALDRLLENFCDPRIGAASGELFLTSDGGANEGVGLYWRFEKWMRKQESRIHSTVGVTGAICAVRKDLFRPLPAGTILDDVYWPLGVAMAGYRVVYDGRAHAFDTLPPAARDEFRRKLRTLVGNFQLLRAMPVALLPWRNPVWLALVSHKAGRLAVPWALLGLLAVSVVRLDEPIYAVLLAGQAVAYATAAAGSVLGRRCRWRLLSAASSFLVLNAAAFAAFFVWAFGWEHGAWRKVRYAGGAHAGESRLD